VQQFGQGGGARPVHSGAHGHLDRFQIHTTRGAAILEDHPQQLVYFTFDFLADRFGRFFSWADSRPSSTGRNSQICSLTSNS
jgi:hypothetical protein